MAGCCVRGVGLLNDRTEFSPLSVGLTWAIRVTSIGLAFSLPAVLGYGCDRLLGTTPSCVLAGACLGFAAGMAQVMSLARNVSPPKPRLPDTDSAKLKL